MSRQRRMYSSEYKLETVGLVLQQNYSIGEAAEAMNIAKSTLSKWVRQVKFEQCGITPKAVAITPEQQKIKELEKRIKRMELENSILKKATALLVSDSINNLN